MSSPELEENKNNTDFFSLLPAEIIFKIVQVGLFQIFRNFVTFQLISFSLEMCIIFQDDQGTLYPSNLYLKPVSDRKCGIGDFSSFLSEFLQFAFIGVVARIHN